MAWPGVRHIGPDRDFTPVIEAALAAPGFAEDAPEKTITVGFGHNAVLGVADKVIAAVKNGQIRHFFLVGGCDGAKPGRNYYTEFAQKVPKDCVILTLACGKYRFNKLEFGAIDGMPRLLDIGQCNDAYSADQDRRGAGRGVQVRRQRTAAVVGPQLVRAEGGGDSADAVAPGHQEHPPGPEPAGVRHAGGAEGAGREVQHRPDHHAGGRSGGDTGIGSPKCDWVAPIARLSGRRAARGLAERLALAARPTDGLPFEPVGEFGWF